MDAVMEYFANFSVEDFLNWLTSLMLIVLAIVAFLQRAQNIIAKFQTKQAQEETHKVKVELLEKEKLEHVRNEGIEAIGDMLNSVIQASKMDNPDKRDSMEKWVNFKNKLEECENQYTRVIKNMEEDARKYAENIFNLGRDIMGTVADTKSTFLDKYNERK